MLIPQVAEHAAKSGTLAILATSLSVQMSPSLSIPREGTQKGSGFGVWGKRKLSGNEARGFSLALIPAGAKGANEGALAIIRTSLGATAEERSSI